MFARFDWFGCILHELSVDLVLTIHESAIEAFLALIRYNEIKIKRLQTKKGKKHVEGFPEQFFKCLRRYVWKHVAP